MASSSSHSTILTHWARDVSADRPPTLRMTRERLAVLGEGVDWTSAPAQHLASRLFYCLPHTVEALAHLDALAGAGAFPALWAVPVKVRHVHPDHFIPWADVCANLLLHSPKASSRKRAEAEWWAIRAIQEGRAFQDSGRHAAAQRALGQWVTQGHEAIAETLIHALPALLDEVVLGPVVPRSTQEPEICSWLDRGEPATARWAWGLAHGMDPMKPSGPQNRPFWWHAAKRGIAVATAWAQVHDAPGYERFEVATYFQSLATVTRYGPQHAAPYEHRLLAQMKTRADWATVRNEAGLAPPWVLIQNHSLECARLSLDTWTAHCPHWKTLADPEGRNLVYAVLSSQDTETANGLRRQALAYLAHREVVPQADAQGRGLFLSDPGLGLPLRKGGRAGWEEAEAHGFLRAAPDAWWGGSESQIQAFVDKTLLTPNFSEAFDWVRAIFTVQPDQVHPRLRGWALLLATLTNHVTPDACVPWKAGAVFPDTAILEASLIVKKALASGARGADLAITIQQAHILQHARTRPSRPSALPRPRS
jgi:hypothetical protein